MQASLSTNISATEKVVIKPVLENFDQNAQLCAINWFDLRHPWLYTLYAALATRYVRKVSGKLCFKGKLVKRLEGPAEQQRDNLLIVRYPTARSFLDLVDYKVFQIVSVLRLAAVRKFCFGFTENILVKTHLSGAKDSSFTKEQFYLVHHFQGDAKWLNDNRRTVFATAQRYRLETYFCGLTNASIVREKTGKQQSVDFFMDGILLFAADSTDAVETFIRDDVYTAFKHSNTQNSLYLFKRTH